MRHQSGDSARLRSSRDTESTRESPVQRLLTVEQAGFYLALGPWRIRNLIWAGELAFVRLGRRVLVDRKDLDAFLDSKKEKHTAP
jgi:excisionase family DNA binding protein